jgi:ketosteroid isomerase-like protein
MTTPPRLDAALKAADDAFFEALLKQDVSALEQALTDDFLIVDIASGGVHTRADFLGAIEAGMVTFQSIERFHDEASVRELGDSGGVVVGRTQMSFLAPDGTQVDAASRYTHVFRRADGRWQLFSAQGTPIAEAAAS